MDIQNFNWDSSREEMQSDVVLRSGVWSILECGIWKADLKAQSTREKARQASRGGLCRQGKARSQWKLRYETLLIGFNLLSLVECTSGSTESQCLNLFCNLFETQKRLRNCRSINTNLICSLVSSNGILYGCEIGASELPRYSLWSLFEQHLELQSESFVGSEIQHNASWWQFDKTKAMVQAISDFNLIWRTKPRVLLRGRFEPFVRLTCDTDSFYNLIVRDHQFGCVISHNDCPSKASISEASETSMAIVVWA